MRRCLVEYKDGGRGFHKNHLWLDMKALEIGEFVSNLHKHRRNSMRHVKERIEDG